MKRKIVVIDSPACFSKADAANNPKCKNCVFLFDCIEKREKNKLENGKESKNV